MGNGRRDCLVNREGGVEVKYLAAYVLLIAWIAGFVLAKGFWSTVACFFPPWAFYLVIERAMQAMGVI